MAAYVEREQLPHALKLAAWNNKHLSGLSVTGSLYSYILEYSSDS